MLTSLRRATDTWLGRIVLSVALGLIIVSFAIWGIGNIFQGFGQSEAASVGRTTVAATSFRRAYQAQLERLQAETRSAVTDAQARAMGLDRDVLSALVADAALTERARILGLAIAPDQVQKLVVDDPSFRGPGGAFEPNRMIQQLGEQGYTQKDLPTLYMRRQIAAALVSGTKAPKTALEIINRFRGETRSLEYAVLTASVAGDIPKPGEAELQKFYDGRRDSYRAREYRDIVVLTLTAASLAKPDQISDAQARAFYDGGADGRYGDPERRTVQQLIFPTEAEATAARLRIEAGASFADIAKDRHLAASSIEGGTKTKAQLGELADTAFALPPGGVSKPVKVVFGYALVRVTSIAASTLKPFEAVASQVKRQIAQSRVRQKDLDDLHERIESLRSAGKPLAEAAKSVSLTPRQIPAIDEQGRDKAGVKDTDLVDAGRLLKAVFASDVGLDNDTLQLASGGYEWFEVRKVEPARERGFTEVKSEVENQWRSAEIARRLNAKAADLVAKLNGGSSLGRLLSGQEVKSIDGVRRGGSNTLPQKLLAEAFATPVGGGGVAQGDADNRIVFRVTSAQTPRFDPNSAEMQRAAANYGNALIGELVRQYAVKLEDEYGLKVNSGVLRTAVGGDPGPAPVDSD